MKKLDEAFAGITAPCCNPDEACACSGAERVLRVYAYRSDTTLPAMTEDLWALLVLTLYSNGYDPPTLEVLTILSSDCDPLR